LIEYRRTIFETDEWIETLVKSYNYRLYTCGEATLLHIRSRIFGNRLISLPFSDYGKIGFIDKTRIQSILYETGVEYVEVRIPEWRSEILKYFHENGFSTRAAYKTFLLDISRNPESIWKFFNKKIRNSIRYAQKNKVETYRVKKPSELDFFYNLYLHGIRELGSPPHSYKFYKFLFDNLGDKLIIDVALLNKKPIASIIVLLGDKWANFWQNITLRKYRRFNASYMLLWNVIRELSEKDFQVFDFGRTRKKTGIYSFKKKWGGLEQDIYHLVYSEKGIAKIPDPNQQRYVLLSKIWRRLPLKATEIIGTKIIGGIAL